MDIVAVSHLRWDFVYQRPQHLMSRAARDHRVLFVEEPADGPQLSMQRRRALPNLAVVTPTVPAGTPADDADAWLAASLTALVEEWRRDDLVLWHWAVMAEPVTRSIDARVVVFDCMDELSLFRGAAPDLVARERALMRRSDLVFTGGHGLWEAKHELHPRVHAFPSGVDVAHFARARAEQPEPEALRGIGRPRLMYAGVIDERIDLRLLDALAKADIGEVVLVGPVVKIEETDLPSHPRLHRLGMRPYEELPALFAHADVGIMPFALNDATRFISPTKTPEYLAAGLPVVSTPLRDVVRGYTELGEAVEIADGPRRFIDACERANPRRALSPAIERHLAGRSWDAIWRAMETLIRRQAAGADAA
jgi:glycosyltransferase involved in cell wall biosynthesis